MPWQPGTPAPPPELPAPDRVLWVLTKAARRAELALRAHPVGVEVRVSVDGSLLLSEVVRAYDGKDTRAVSERHRAAFLERGWAAASD